MSAVPSIGALLSIAEYNRRVTTVDDDRKASSEFNATASKSLERHKADQVVSTKVAANAKRDLQDRKKYRRKRVLESKKPEPNTRS